MFYFCPVTRTVLLSFEGAKKIFAKLSGCAEIFRSGAFRRYLFGAFFCFLVRIPVVLILTLVLTRLLGDPGVEYGNLFHALVFLPYTASLMSCSVVFGSLFTPSKIIGEILAKVKLSSIS